MKNLFACSLMGLAVSLLLTLPAVAGVGFIEYMIDPALAQAQDVNSADMDNDGDIDILACGYYADEVRWYENTGTSQWPMHYIDENFYGAWSVYPIDLDQDGDMDVVGGAYMADDVVWWENDGNQNFTEHPINTNFNGVECVRATDLDLDGDYDVVAASFLDDRITWWENNGSQNWAMHTIDTGIAGACYISILDFDLDGDIDLIGAARVANDILWWENNGAQQFTQHTIDVNFTGARSVCSCDIDSDGDLDAIGAADDGDCITWWQNDGLMGFTRYDISSNFYGAWSVCTADIDQDGDWDVVGTADEGAMVTWWENDLPNNWIEHTIADDFFGGSVVHGCDINNDTRCDLVAVAFVDGDVKLWTNMGTTPQVVIEATPTSTPLIVERGASFEYDVDIYSFLTQPINAYVWTEATLPNGSAYGPVFQVQVPFTPDLVINVDGIQQAVPIFAPTGTYAWIVGIGLNPNLPPIVADTFLFTVTDPVLSSAETGATEWSTNGSQRILDALNVSQPAVAASTLPDVFALTASPNPFNAQTTLSIDLPESAELTVTVYNVTGQQVAILMDQNLAPGTHELTFDASHLSAGVYFVRASTTDWNAVRKIVLLK